MDTLNGWNIPASKRDIFQEIPNADIACLITDIEEASLSQFIGQLRVYAHKADPELLLVSRELNCIASGFYLIQYSSNGNILFIIQYKFRNNYFLVLDTHNRLYTFLSSQRDLLGYRVKELRSSRYLLVPPHTPYTSADPDNEFAIDLTAFRWQPFDQIDSHHVPEGGWKIQ